MPYTSHNWIAGDSANASRLNNLESQYTESTLSINPDMLTAFVVSGLVATKDGSVANQLDVTSGKAYLAQADGTTRQRVTSASTPGQFLTGTPSSTYYLFLNNDGTFTWSTTSTGPANSLAICQATTDGSGNILVVTDKRNLVGRMFSGAAGAVAAQALGTIQTANAYLLEVDTGTDVFDNLQAPDNAARKRHLRANAGSNVQNDFLVGNTDGSATLPGKVAGVAGQATAGSFGVPVVVAVTKRQNVVNTTNTSIATWTNSTGVAVLVRVWQQVWIGAGNTNPGVVTCTYTYTDPDNGAGTATFVTPTGTLLSASTQSQGLLKTQVAEAFVSTGTTVTVKYQNTAAGTISDFVTTSIEVLG